VYLAKETKIWGEGGGIREDPPPREKKAVTPCFDSRASEGEKKKE